MLFPLQGAFLFGYAYDSLISFSNDGMVMMPRLKLSSPLSCKRFSSSDIFSRLSPVSLASLVIFMRTVFGPLGFMTCDRRNPIILPCVSSLNVRHAFRCAFCATVDTMPTRLRRKMMNSSESRMTSSLLMESVSQTVIAVKSDE